VFQNASVEEFLKLPQLNIVSFDGKPFGFMPFIRNNEQFTKLALAMYERGVRTIFCHGEFDGAKYENGFYAPHGVDLKAFPSDLYFISGHIHAQQEFGNVWYPGTPRHLTRSDAGETKGIWFYETKTGRREFVPTPVEVAEPFQEFTLTPESTLRPEQIPTSDRVFVDVRGPQEFVKATIKQLSPNVRVRSFPDQKKAAVDIKESEGIPVAFVKYASKYFMENNVSLEVAKKVIEKVYTKCPSLRTGI
jgi:DNA repair exonuclease SbcCD nuclease subunit